MIQLSQMRFTVRSSTAPTDPVRRIGLHVKAMAANQLAAGDVVVLTAAGRCCGIAWPTALAGQEGTSNLIPCQ
jgi:hypothetical protein